MWMTIMRGVIAGLVVIGVTELSNKYPRYGALLLSLPLVSILAFLLAWSKYGELTPISNLAKETLILLPLSLPFFVPFVLAGRLDLTVLANCPIRQNATVIGANSRRGEVPAVGGVNEKVEGFFDACRERGLTGTRGVRLPEKDVRHQVLCRAVFEAIGQKQFHIWSVSTVDQVINLFTSTLDGTI